MERIPKETIEKIKNAYYDPATGLGSAQQLFEQLNKEVKLKDIKIVLQNLEIKQIKNNQINENLFIPISAPPNAYQCDLTFYSQFAKNNSGFEILLTIINVNTKYAYVYPLKNKNTTSIINAFNKFLNEVKDKIYSISADAGSEFINKELKKLLSENNIELLIFKNNKNATSVIERLNRSLRSKIDSYMKAYKTYRFIDKLPDLVKNYNNSIHNKIGLKPNQVDTKMEYNIALDNVINKVQVQYDISNQFKINDQVRILKKKDTFAKGNTNYYSKSIYQIIEKDGNGYIVKNLNNGKTRKAYPYQLQLIDKNNLITNPFIDQENGIKQNLIFEKNKKINKINRALRRDGLPDLNEQNKKKRLDNELKKLI